MDKKKNYMEEDLEKDLTLEDLEEVEEDLEKDFDIDWEV